MPVPLTVLVPGSLDAKTGGYIYDRRMVDGLRALGWSVTVRELDGSFPSPTPAALEDAAAALRDLEDEALVLIDGLALGAMPDVAAREARRLRLVALVHHPLAAETGLSPEAARRFADSERAALAAVRRVIVTSRTTAASLHAYAVPADRVAVVEPGTERVPAAAGSQSSTVELLCVATLTPRKGHETLFRALATIDTLRWHLTCAGGVDRDPATSARLQTLLRELNLEDRVSLAGEQDEAALAALYHHADVFVLPTEYEGYGMAVAEAIARGLPVISTPTGAIPQIVTKDAGVLVPPGDVDALADVLARIIGDPRERQRLAREAVLVRDRLPSWRVAALTMAAALERAGNR